MDITLATLSAAFLVGLFGTVHCIAMCGGIAEVRQRSGAALACQLGYNVGRIASYALAGALVGLLGRLFATAAGLEGARLLLQGLAGVFMLLLGFYLTGWWPLLARLERLTEVDSLRVTVSATNGLDHARICEVRVYGPESNVW